MIPNCIRAALKYMWSTKITLNLLHLLLIKSKYDIKN